MYFKCISACETTAQTTLAKTMSETSCQQLLLQIHLCKVYLGIVVFSLYEGFMAN